MRYFLEPTGENPKYPCGTCQKNVSTNHNAIQCDLCNYWTHIKCDRIDNKDYENLKKSNDTYFCKICKEETIPFQKLSNQQFFTSVTKDIKDINENSSLKIFPTSNEKSLFNELNGLNLPDDDLDEPRSINCEYYDADQPLPKLDNNRNFSLFHINIASLGKHKDEFEDLLSILDQKFDVMGITETKIKKDCVPIFDLSIDGYNCFHTPTESEKGGALLYIKDQHNCKIREDLNKEIYKPGKLESIFIEIINKNKKNIIIGCVYRHPSMDIDDFNSNHLEQTLEKISNENKDVFLLGDWNIDLMKTDEDKHIREFYDIITTNLMVPHIVLPTRLTSNSKTLIDNIFSNAINFDKGISGNITASISDHLPQFLIIPKENYQPPKKHNIFKRDVKNFDKETFVAEIINTNWNTVLSIEKGDPNYSFEMFNSKINQLLDKYVPLKKVTKKDFKHQLKPWVTSGICKSIKRRDKLLQKFIKAKDAEIKNELHLRYKTLRNQIVSLIRTSKKQHFQQYFTENSNNIRKTWKGIKNIINVRSSTLGQPTSMKIGKEISTDPSKIAEGFNEFFSSIAKNLQDKIYFAGENYSNYLGQSSDYRFLFESADTKEIILIIDSFDNNKAQGPYSIPTDVLKIIKSNICYPLKEIINLSFATGIYPTKLKIARVNPIFKNKGDPLNFSNYRPISLLSNINKIFEKLVYSRLYSFLNLHNSIYDLQFGFRAKHSTNHALISLTESIREALDNGNFACGIFIDLQKAFDTVDHFILLKKLEHYGIRGRANEWFQSYLSNRQQFVSINGFESKPLAMNYGVPQGSVLGPLLFLIYINDLHNAIKYSTTLHFADDTNLLAVNESLKKLQKQVNLDLRFLCNWLKANKISLNASKTELVIFRHPNKPINYDLKIKINGKKLIPSSFIKYLGILIDCHLNWQIHSNDLATKLSRAIGMLSKIRHYVKFATLRMIYYGIFSSLLFYGSQIWGQSNSQSINKLQILQNKALRILTFNPPRTSAGPLFKECKILKLADNVKLQNFLFAYDNLKNTLPSALKDSLNTVDNVHRHETRSFTYKQYELPSVTVSNLNRPPR